MFRSLDMPENVQVYNTSGHLTWGYYDKSQNED
jgi:hypothetical protein